MLFTAQINLPVGTPQNSVFALLWSFLPPPTRSLLKLETQEIIIQLDAPIPVGATIQVGSAIGFTGFELDATSPQYRLDVPFRLSDLTLANFGPVAAMVNITVVQQD